jgi:phosphopantothenoylcysteine decarboxylase/phosphopantothenate--cysteine ligase
LRIVLGVTGGIAAYKATELIRLFRASGHDVHVIPTQNALQFIGKSALEALSGHSVSADVFNDVENVAHVSYGQTADLIVVAPATASFLARYAAGIADDLLGNTLLATKAPVLVAPAMHTEMWQHAATIANVSTLRSRGVTVLDPATGALTSGDVGVGRLPDASAIADAALALIGKQDLSGKRFLITAGGTRAALDPVRFLGNHSSGKQGIAIANAAAARGATVTVIGANLEVAFDGRLIGVETNGELEAALLAELPNTDVLVMAAAVADFSPVDPSDVKLKRGEGQVVLRLAPQKDLLTEAATYCEQSGLNVLRVGFAAETAAGDALVAAALSKLKRKRCQLVVANDVSGGAIFGQEATSVKIVNAAGEVAALSGTKLDVANGILDQIVTVR